MGVMEMDTGGLSWLTNYENQCHAVHLKGIYVHPDCKGDGLFRSMMEILKSISAMYGVFIYFVARAFLINLPTIKTPEQFTHFINHKDDYFSYYHNKSTERHLSKELGKTYKRFGFCHLVVDADDVQDRFWRGSVLCSIPENMNPELEEAIKGRVYCDETEFVTELKRLGICHNEGSNRRNRKKDKRKRRKSTSEVKEIVAEAIANSPEIQALLNDEDLIGSFGFYGGSAEQQANAIIKSVTETTEVRVTVSLKGKSTSDCKCSTKAPWKSTRVTRRNHKNQRLRSELVGMAVDEGRHDCGRWLDV